MKVTAQILASIFGSSPTAMAQWVDPINSAFEKAAITTKERAAMFLAQVGHESARLTAVRENLNYSSDGLANTWPSRFGEKNSLGNYVKVMVNGNARIKPNAKAVSLNRQPEAIANSVYADRLGNGNEASGDGWKYRGRGLIQTTGKSNYTACGNWLGIDLVKNPELLETSQYAALSAAWYWQANNLNAYADRKDVPGATKVINGGANGLPDRQALFNSAMNSL